MAGDVLTYGSPESVGMLAQPLEDMEANLTAYTRFVNGTRPLEPGSATLVARLPPDLQRAARDSYAIALRAVFIMAACSTFLAYCARLPVSCLH